MIKSALKGTGKIKKQLEAIPDGTDEPAPKKKKASTVSKKKEKAAKTIETEADGEANDYEEKKGGDEIVEEPDFQVMGDLESIDAANKKAGGKKAKKGKKGKKKKEAQLDGIARFFNDYGESPHLQAIEMSYLTYL